jgi:hypothetical protein
MKADPWCRRDMLQTLLTGGLIYHLGARTGIEMDKDGTESKQVM